MVGVNHHQQTIVFGFGLLVDETIKTYTWVLQNILVAMNNKTLISIVIDGDKAISKAIKMVFPESRHHLCVWLDIIYVCGILKGMSHTETMSRLWNNHFNSFTHCLVPIYHD